MNSHELKAILEKHTHWINCDCEGWEDMHADLRFTDLRGANLQGANLYNADLQGANLYNANLRGADIDYSCLPLWCGSLSANFDSKHLKQIAYHLVKAGLNSTNATDEDKRELSKLIDYANGFHRAQECGVIKGNSEIEK